MDADGGGRGGRVSVRPCAQVGRPLSGRGRGRAARSVLGAAGRWPTAPPSRRVEAIAALRRLRFTAAGDRRGCSDWPLSTVSGILTRIGMGRLGRLGLRARPALRARTARRADPHRRQEARPDRRRRRQARHRRLLALQPPAAPTRAGHAPRHGRLGLRPHRRSTTAPGSPTPKCSPTRRPPPRSASCAARSRSSPATASTSRRLLTDNGSPYRSTVHAIACRALGIRHLRTRPRRPQTNGKAERFIRTMLGGWAYGAIYRSSHRTHRRP